MLADEIECVERRAGGVGVGEVGEHAAAIVPHIAEADAGGGGVLVEDVEIAVIVEVAENHAAFGGARRMDVADRVCLQRKDAAVVAPGGCPAAREVAIDDVGVAVIVVVDDEQAGHLLAGEIECVERRAGGIGVGEVGERPAAVVLHVAEADAGRVAVLVEDVDIAVTVEVAKNQAGLRIACRVDVADRVGLGSVAEGDGEDAPIGLPGFRRERDAGGDGADGGVEAPGAAERRRADRVRRCRDVHIAERLRQAGDEPMPVGAACDVACVDLEVAARGKRCADLG